MYTFKKLFNPEIFQGKNKKKNYFEGWYYKIVDKDEKHSLAFIPGVAFDKDGNGHSFIQVIDSLEYNTEYFKFPLADFSYSKKDLDISIGSSTFRNNQIDLNLTNEQYSVSGHLDFSDIIPFPKTMTRPGVMGPFSFVPFMECYHGVVNIDHKISGSLMINNEEVDFTDGYGYIEKDWGKSFPNWYVWIQSNYFSTKDASIMFSIADIPWFSKSFTGFLSFLKIKEEIYMFATYTGAKIKHLEYSNGVIDITIEDKKHLLTISGSYDKSGILKAPKNGLMERTISESISSKVKVVLKDKKGNIIFEDYGEKAGLEVVGKHL